MNDQIVKKDVQQCIYHISATKPTHVHILYCVFVSLGITEVSSTHYYMNTVLPQFNGTNIQLNPRKVPPACLEVLQATGSPIYVYEKWS